MSFLDSMADVEHALSRKSDGRTVQKIALDRISSDPNQPRKAFDQKALEELAQSIKERGVLQPVTLRTMDEGKTYVVRFGDRRFRAARLAGLADIPAIVTEDAADENELLDQVIENDQRADLSPIEMAAAVEGMIKQGLSKETISKRLGRPRPDISMYAVVSEFPEELGGEFLTRSSLRSAYNLFVAWKAAPEPVLAFVADHPDGVTTARAAAFVQELKGQRAGPLKRGSEEEEVPADPLFIRRPAATEPAELGGGGELELSGTEAAGPDRKRAKGPAAAKPRRETSPVFVQVHVGGKPAKMQLPNMVQVTFDDGELRTIAATDIDPS